MVGRTKWVAYMVHSTRRPWQNNPFRVGKVLAGRRHRVLARVLSAQVGAKATRCSDILDDTAADRPRARANGSPDARGSGAGRVFVAADSADSGVDWCGRNRAQLREPTRTVQHDRSVRGVWRRGRQGVRRAPIAAERSRAQPFPGRPSRATGQVRYSDHSGRADDHVLVSALVVDILSLVYAELRYRHLRSAPLALL